MTLASRNGSVEVSVLVPAKDEAENLPEFVRQCAVALEGEEYSCEVVIVNDGSVDDTAEILRQLASENAFVQVVSHRSQRGIADALRTAGDRARGKILVFYPADLQYAPNEIPGLVEPIRNDVADMVTARKEGNYEKAFVSRVYNWLCRFLFGVQVTDLNAAKAYRREIMDVLPARPDWHRFMAVIAAAEGFRLAERSVTLYPRRAGQSKFGLGRIPVGVLDLMSVWFQLRFGRKPMLFFGLSGGILFLVGFVVGVAALVLRFGYGYGFRPLLDLVMVLVISGIALFGFGFVGEMLAGTREEIRSLAASIDRLTSEIDGRR
ncbi:MAG: DPM/DPG synthase family glycosyltransferase [Gemmatimonadales bacterium]